MREIVLRMRLSESERVCSMDHVTHRRKAQEKLYVCVCVCVCVREREREKERKREGRERVKRKREGEVVLRRPKKKCKMMIQS